jgi:DNA modification methylase
MIGDCTLYLGDCLEILPTLPAGAVDAVVTDPPYNLGIDYGLLTNDSRSDYLEWSKKWFGFIESINLVAISCGVANVSTWCSIKPPDWILCWHKSFSVSHGAFGFSNWEPVLIYGKTGKHERQSDYFHATFIKDKSTNGHPCPKPIKWGVGILTITTDNGNTILDPFMGSGTTGVACVQTGRKFIGIEIDEKYFDIACKRIEKAQQQIRMEI